MITTTTKVVAKATMITTKTAKTTTTTTKTTTTKTTTMLNCLDDMTVKGPPRPGFGRMYFSVHYKIICITTLIIKSPSINISNGFAYPAIAHFKGPVDFMPYCERCLIANI